MADREVWLRKTVMGEDGKPLLDEAGKPVKDTLRVMPAQIREALDAQRSRYLQERASDARSANKAHVQDGPRRSQSIERQGGM